MPSITVGSLQRLNSAHAISTRASHQINHYCMPYTSEADGRSGSGPFHGATSTKLVRRLISCDGEAFNSLRIKRLGCMRGTNKASRSTGTPDAACSDFRDQASSIRASLHSALHIGAHWVYWHRRPIPEGILTPQRRGSDRNGTCILSIMFRHA